jgi:hypothetical protein
MQLIKFKLLDGQDPKVIPMNVNNKFYQVSMQVVPTNGAIYSVDATLDNPQSPHPMVFFPVSSTLTNQSITQQVSLTDPVRAYRVSVAGGEVEVKIQQQGIN